MARNMVGMNYIAKKLGFLRLKLFKYVCVCLVENVSHSTVLYK